MTKKITSVILAFIAIVSVFGINAFATGNAGDECVSFKASAYRYVAEKGFDETPSTFEAWIFVNQGHGGEIGNIITNIQDKGEFFRFCVLRDGKPAFVYRTSDGTETTLRFNTDVRSGAWVHLAIVCDWEAKTAACFVNGEQIGENLTTPTPHPDSFKSYYAIGCSLTQQQYFFFEGSIRGVAVYSDVRTKDEIKADMGTVNAEDENLIAYYNLESEFLGMTDQSKNKNNLTKDMLWFKDKEPVTDYEYSICVIPDTQVLNYYDSENFHKIYDWIVDNAEEKKMQYVISMGDITEKDLDEEWQRAQAGFSRLEGLVNYAVVRGNHDTTEGINKYFNNEKYKSQADSFYNDKVETSCHKFTVGDTKWMIVTLDFGGSEDPGAVQWASQVMKDNPDYKVILATHCFLHSDGTVTKSTHIAAPTMYYSDKYMDPDKMWEIFKTNENLTMILSGHFQAAENTITQMQGDNGNMVTMMLLDPQDTELYEITRYPGAGIGMGNVVMLYFNKDGDRVDIETYSTVRDMYFMQNNQRAISLSGKEISDTAPEKDQQGGNGEGQGANNSSWYIYVIIGAAVVAVAAVAFVVLKKKKTKA